MSKLQDEILLACRQLKLQVDFDFQVTLDDGHKVKAAARVRDVGAKNGMLVVSDFEDIKNSVDSIINAGYGYSVIDEPGPSMQFDLESYAEMFRDWGWSGGKGREPDWFFR